jgi:ubiquinone/menaquinone biosynthesis C-methylase UbiE
MLESRMMESVAGFDVLISRAEISPGMNVLDAGCGHGRVSLPMAKYVAPAGKVTAMDVQAKMLTRLKQRMNKAEVCNLEVIHAGLGDGVLPIAAFDRAIMVTVLGEIPDQSRALMEVFRALKPNGILSITEVLPDPHYQRKKEVWRLGEDLGFIVTEVYAGRRSYTLNLIKSECRE